LKIKPQRTSIGQLGEFGLIDHLTKKFKVNHPSTLKSIGDDAAVLDFKNKSSHLNRLVD
jgi:thiamine-monophosphate kinase